MPANTDQIVGGCDRTEPPVWITVAALRRLPCRSTCYKRPFDTPGVGRKANQDATDGTVAYSAPVRIGGTLERGADRCIPVRYAS